MMQTNNEEPLILTLRIDEQSQQFFNDLRLRYFPPERNYLQAHLTLFHKLPNNQDTLSNISNISQSTIDLEVSKLISLGAGVVYRVESSQLTTLRAHTANLFRESLSPQDRQGFQGHITVQNKTSPQIAKVLLEELSINFQPFMVKAIGLDLWTYLGGPWAHKQYFPFNS